MNVRRSPGERVADHLPAGVSGWCRRVVEYITFPPDMSADVVAVCREVLPFTMTSPERAVALRDA
jgi:hypothetical protein